MGTYFRNKYEDSVIKFSIIIPVYNVEKFLRECLDSITSQTLKNFEVICVNDGSTDNSLAILQDYANKDSRFKIISQENQGPGIARNNAIDIAQGQYLLFVDPDDFIEPNTLEKIYGKFQQTDVDVIQFDFSTCKENGRYNSFKSFKKRMHKNFHYSIKDNEIYNWRNIKKKNLQGMSLCVWDKAYKMNLIKANNIRLAPNKHGEDHIFSISSNLLADKILYINKAFYHYRTRLGSSVNKPSNDNFCIFENIKLLRNFLMNNNLFDEYKVGFEDYVSTALSWHYSNIPIESVDKYLNKCKEILSTQNYEKFLEKSKGDFSNIEKIFSIKNQKINGVKVKYLTIFGIKIKLLSKGKGTKNEA